ncbi:MAG TPA: M14 family metallopeptidase, partial [Thermomicrobiales bacterium]|nr:M14 family metallopeptidase [Thermomicrobiales bacterium]
MDRHTSQRATPALPAPREWFGHEVGEPRRLIRWPAMTAYFRNLAARSDRMDYEEIGLDSMGQPLVLLTISSPSNLNQADRLCEVQQMLADPRRITGKHKCRSLVEEARCVCLITCSIHGSEVGATQTAPELVYDLLTRTDDEVLRILDECVVLIAPSLNPGGLEIVAEWYQKTLGTPYEGTPPPDLYHPYAGHDNNRDWTILSQPETRLMVSEVYRRWRPHIVFDLHQMPSNGPRYVLPPYIDPYDENIDPLLQAEVNAIGNQIAMELTARGKRGVATSIIFDAFSPARAFAFYHGGVRVLSEAASAKIATPIEIPPSDLATTRGFEPDLRRANHPLPWPGGSWGLRDIIDYNKLAVFAALNHGARYRDRWVENGLQVQRNALAERTPFGFLFPPVGDQPDPGAAADLLDLLRVGGTEVEQAEEPFAIEGVTFPAGTHLIRTAQPYGRWAKTLLEVQHYPALRLYPGGPPKLPYDTTAHTLPLMMGVDTIQMADSLPTIGTFRRVECIERPRGGVCGDATGSYLIGAGSNAAYRMINHLLAQGAEVQRLPTTQVIGGRLRAAGTFVVANVERSAIHALAIEQGIQVNAIAAAEFRANPIHAARIGLYRSWMSNAIDEGWTRFVLESYDFPFTTLRDAQIRHDDLASSFDVIVLPQQSARDMIKGNSASDYPADYAGGIGPAGLENLKRFAEEGGTIVAID